MTFKTLIGSMLVVATLVANTSFAFAADETATTLATEPATITVATSSTTSDTGTDEAIALAELKSLKQKEQDPTLGFFTRLIIGFKVKQLENQLNIKKALK